MIRRLAFIIVIGLATLRADARQSPAEIDAAFRAFESGNYAQARATLEALGHARNARAQAYLGQMFERGLGVVRNYVRAYYWYSLAATTGNAEYLAALDALTKKMSPEEVAAAQETVAQESPVTTAVTASSFLGTVTLSRAQCSAFGEQLQAGSVYTFRPDATADQMVFDILYYSGLRPNFQVRAANVPNAAAAVEGEQRFILYNPDFMRQVATSTGTDWGAYSIMAHEIGHHLQGHTLESGGSRPPIELEADEFSGFILARMDGTLAQAQAAMRQLAGEQGSETHPGRAQRLEAIRIGWERGQNTRTSAPSRPPDVRTAPREQRPPAPERSTPLPQPMPQVRVASACMTDVGACPMMVPIPAGSSCWCNFGPYGNYPGIAR